MSVLTKTAYKAKYTDNTSGEFATNTSQAINSAKMRTFAEDTADSFAVSGGLNWVVVQIGDWNMDTTGGVTIAHGLADFTKIRSISCIIRNDTNGSYTDLTRGGGSALSNDLAGWIGLITTTDISLLRFTGGFFDSTSYDSTSFNRGWITIGYVD